VAHTLRGDNGRGISGRSSGGSGKKKGADAISGIEEQCRREALEAGRREYERVLNDAAAAEPVEACSCLKCGREMKHRGFEKRQVASQMGDVTLSRRCYTCPKGCGGYAPFDARLGLYGKWSTGMQEWMQYAAAKDSFDGGAESIEKFSGVVASASSVREVAEWHGTRKEEEQQRAIEDARGRMTRPADDSATPHRLYVGVDGAHVPERPEWKECKVGVVFATSSKRPLTPRRRTYVAGIEPVELSKSSTSSTHASTFTRHGSSDGATKSRTATGGNEHNRRGSSAAGGTRSCRVSTNCLPPRTDAARPGTILRQTARECIIVNTELVASSSAVA